MIRGGKEEEAKKDIAEYEVGISSEEKVHHSSSTGNIKKRKG